MLDESSQSATAFAIVPAAGDSKRMGQSKLLLPWQGRTLLEHAIAAWKASRVRAIFVVVRPDDQVLARIAENAGAMVVRPPLPPPDMRASICFGLGEIRRLFSPTAADAWLMAPADIPRVSSQVIDRLISAHLPDQPAALVPTVGGKRGHPVLFPWPWTERIKHLAEDQGLNALVAEGPTRELDCSDLVTTGAFDDIDTRAEYESL